MYIPTSAMESDIQTMNPDNTLHHALGPFLLVSQFFGVLPLGGIWPSANVQHVHFRWFSLAVLLTLILIGFNTIDLFLSAKVVAENGLKLYTVGPLSFSIVCLAGFIVFLWLAHYWPNLIKQTYHCELIFLRKSYTNHESKYFSRRIRIFGITLLVGVIVEHLSYVSSAVYNNNLQIIECNLTVDFWRNYFMRERLQIFTVIEYHAWLIPLIEWITISMTFTWNFIDIFLILISQCMIMRFKQMHWRIKYHSKERMSSDFWLEIRQDFLTLIELLSQYDNKFSGLILLSCSHNMYFICAQIFHGFHNKGNFMNEIYFWCTSTYVLVRVLTMMFSAASIYDVSNKILYTMYKIPTSYWCLELKRLNEILVSDVIALSGKGFFFLTRHLIFAMAGTIVVYELVLIDKVDDSEVRIDYCATRRSL